MAQHRARDLLGQCAVALGQLGERFGLADGFVQQAFVLQNSVQQVQGGGTGPGGWVSGACVIRELRPRGADPAKDGP